jgi:uncharacterized membrane protein
MKSITTLQTTSAAFSTGKALSDGWAIVAKNLGYYILGGILTVVIGGAAGIIPFVGSIANSVIISPCFMASAIFISWHISKGIAWTDFGEIFKGFNFLLPIVISSLIQSVAMGVLVVLFFFNYMPQLKDIYDLLVSPDAYNNRSAVEAIVKQFLNLETLLLFSLLMFALLLLSIVWAFKNHFIVIYKMEAWPAMEMSRKITTNNLLPLAGLFILLTVIIIVSALPCGIGLLFSLPLSITAVYSAFAQITECDKTAIDNDMFDFIAEENKEL